MGLGNLGRIGKIHETLHFAILDHPNVHQRKVETLKLLPVLVTVNKFSLA